MSGKLLERGHKIKIRIQGYNPVAAVKKRDDRLRRLRDRMSDKSAPSTQVAEAALLQQNEDVVRAQKALAMSLEGDGLDEHNGCEVNGGCECPNPFL